MEFKSGRIDQSFDVPPAVYDELRNAESIRTYANEVIKPPFAVAELVFDLGVG